MTKIIGRWALTRDPVKTTTKNGTPVANCGAADNIITSKNGETTPVFFELVAWNELSETLATFKKGEIVEIEGYFLPRPWTDKQGVQRVSYQVTLNSISKYEKPADSKTPSKSTENPSTKPTSEPAPEPAQTSAFVDIPDDDEDLPF
jgi:single stranded DNA-binding protein